MRKIALLLGLIIAIVLLAGPRASDEDALHHAAEEARADLIQVPEGYSLIATINYLEGFDNKPGIRTQMRYIKKDNFRIDTLHKNKEKRQYRIREGDSLTKYECEKKNEKWVCDNVGSILDVSEYLDAGYQITTADCQGFCFHSTVKESRNFEYIFCNSTSAEQISYRKIAGIKAKCYSYPDGVIKCYHPTALILLYLKGEDFIMEVTSWDLNVPDDELFVLP